MLTIKIYFSVLIETQEFKFELRLIRKRERKGKREKK